MRAPVCLGALDQVAVFQQLRDRERHEQPALVDGRDGDVAEQRRRQALHHHVAVVGERGRRAQGDHVADLRQHAARSVGIAHRDGGERQARHAVDQPPRHFQADRAETGKPTRKDGLFATPAMLRSSRAVRHDAAAFDGAAMAAEAIALPLSPLLEKEASAER